MIRMILLLSLALLCIAVPAQARQIDAEDRAAIAERVRHLDAAMRSGRMEQILDVLPPRLLNAAAGRFGVTPDELRRATAHAATEMLESVTIVSYSMDAEAALQRTTPDGARTYLLIPTETIMEMPLLGRSRARSHTLALEDEGAWYLVRTEDTATQALLAEVYPEFSGVEFPASIQEDID